MNSAIPSLSKSYEQQHFLEIKSIRPGSALKYSALFAVVYAFLTCLPLAIVMNIATKDVISLLWPLLHLFLGRNAIEADALAHAGTLIFWIFLGLVVAILVFCLLFTLLATLAYNALAGWSGGLKLSVKKRP